MLQFREENVALILGPRCNGDIVSSSIRGPNPNLSKLSKKMLNQHHDVIKDNLVKLIYIKDGEEEIFVKLLVI